MMSVQQKYFIGREQEIAFLTTWIADEDALSVVYIHDALQENEKKGGIGKTWLLREFYGILEQKHKNVIPVVMDFFNVLDRDGVIIAERVVEAVRKKYPKWSAEDFFKLLNEYREIAHGRIAETAILRERLADALAADLRMLQQQMVETDTFLMLFFDTYELIEYNPIVAVLRPAQTFPDNYRSNRVRTIIAGRNAIDWTHQNWVGRKGEVIVHTLPPFNYDETIEYLHNRLDIYNINSISSDIMQALYQRTEGRPILLGLVADVLNKRITLPETLVAIDKSMFEASLVEEINHFEDPSKWIVFSMAHIYHRFDAAFVDRLLNWPGLKGLVPEIQFRELVKELPTLSFVRSSDSGEDFVLHDEMRRLVNKYCWEIHDQDGRIRRELSKLAVNHYNELIVREENEEQRLSYIVEKLFHELYLDVGAGFQSFEKHFNYAIDFSLRAFARALLQELQKFEPRFTHEQRLAMKLSEVRVLREEENPASALEKLSALEEDKEWAGQHRSDLLFEKGSCYLRLNQYPQSISSFEACLKIEQLNRDKARYALLLNRLGYIHRLQGRYAEARHYYDEALKVQRNLDNPREYANLLNNMGNVLRLQGKLEDALRYCKLALRIRRDLFLQNKISEYYVGLSLSTLGHIYHTLREVKEEEKAYQEAFDIYNRVGDKSAIADAYNCLGRVWVEKGDLKSARENYEQASRIASGVSRLTEIESYNQLGRVSLVQEKWEEAISSFEIAIELSRQLGLDFQLAENLLYYAEAHDRIGLSWNEQIKEAKRIARNNDYTYLLARAGELQGDIYLRRKEYQSAVKHYRVACRYMTLRGFPEYNRTLRKLNDVLLEIPSNFLPGIIDSLLSYWYELGLDGKYPELLEVCREVSRHMLL
jgi:tetratricopeptide (TPR) repeat protein